MSQLVKKNKPEKIAMESTKLYVPRNAWQGWRTPVNTAGLSILAAASVKNKEEGHLKPKKDPFCRVSPVRQMPNYNNEYGDSVIYAAKRIQNIKPKSAAVSSKTREELSTTAASVPAKRPASGNAFHSRKVNLFDFRRLQKPNVSTTFGDIERMSANTRRNPFENAVSFQQRNGTSYMKERPGIPPFR